ncbi:MAG: hypothetical protein VKL23_02625 [Cyanobacteriota bacterium]|nr:hypothetical protein [Cyanobacteriota bacterium]
MSTSHSAAPSPLISKQEYYSSLPWFRRCLAMLNWRPVVDYELREIEFKKRQIAHEHRMKQLDDEDAAFNARMQSLDAKLDALWPSSNSSTTQHQPPESDSGTSSP